MRACFLLGLVQKHLFLMQSLLFFFFFMFSLLVLLLPFTFMLILFMLLSLKLTLWPWLKSWNSSLTWPHVALLQALLVMLSSMFLAGVDNAKWSHALDGAVGCLHRWQHKHIAGVSWVISCGRLSWVFWLTKPLAKLEIVSMLILIEQDKKLLLQPPTNSLLFYSCLSNQKMHYFLLNLCVHSQNLCCCLGDFLLFCSLNFNKYIGSFWLQCIVIETKLMH